MKKNLIIKVALSLPVYSLFDYKWSKDTEPPPVGARVSVLVRDRVCVGVVLGFASQSKVANLKSITRKIDTSSIISNEIIYLCKWASSYYHQPVGNTVISILPKLLKQGQAMVRSKEKIYELSEYGKLIHDAELKGLKQKQLLQLLKKEKSLTKSQIVEQKISSATLNKLIELNLITIEEEEITYIKKSCSLEQPLILNLEQQQALEFISNGLNEFYPHLLYGVTGSGKTEIYMQIIKKVLDNNKQILVLIPEIGLTPQMLLRFQQRFDVHISIMHSSLSEKQKLDAWIDAKNGKTRLLIGTRSALFTPMPKLGLIIIDEEHDSSYKQTERFRYHARDLSIIRAKNLKIPIILGSATPSLESMHNAISNKYHFIKLSKRANLSSMPKCKIIDMRNTYHDISDELVQNISLHLEQKSQILLFLNRRGFATVMLCPACGWSAKCNFCNSNFTYHKESDMLLCHTCLFKQKLPPQCPECKLANLKPIGIGTEKLAEIIQDKFPTAAIIRIDQDTTRKKNSFIKYLDDINSDKPMILIGTQMIAKGHHFNNVTMVGILGADSGLYSSDFHAIEKLGQTITQVSGRAGRESKSGVVFIQTHNPEHAMLKCLTQNDYLSFLDNLLIERKATDLPPFSAHALLLAEADSRTRAIEILNNVNKILQKKIQNDIQVFGPFPAINEKSKGKYRYHLLLQASRKKDLQKMLTNSILSITKIKLTYKSRWIIDVDPIDII